MSNDCAMVNAEERQQQPVASRRPKRSLEGEEGGVQGSLLRSTSRMLMSPSKRSPRDAASLLRQEGDSMISRSKEEHRTLVQAIYEVGLKHSSPAVIQEQMIATNKEEVTGERLKSHLQKYRKNRDKSRDEFLDEYDAWLDNALAVNKAGVGGGDSSIKKASTVGEYLIPPAAVAEMTGTTILLGGEAPAFISYSVMHEQITGSCPGEDGNLSEPHLPPSQMKIDFRQDPRAGAAPLSSPDAYQEFSFPILTDEERNSALGSCLSRVMGLFHPMSRLLLSEREKNRSLEPSGNFGSSSGSIE